MSVTKSNKQSSSSTAAAVKSHIDPSIPPNQTIYVKNIDSKIKKNELKKQLYFLFSTYGKVLDVIVTRKDGMRGQAFVCFEDLASSTSALRSLDGFSFYNQPLQLNYAKSKSNASIVQEFGQEALFDPTFMSKKKEKVTFSTAGADLQGRERKRLREEAGQRGEVVSDNEEQEEEEENAQNKTLTEGQPDSKRRKPEKVEGDSDSDDGASMQMEDSDSEQEG